MKHTIQRSIIEKVFLYSCAVLGLLFYPAAADIISGTVTDSATGKALFHVKVGTDSAHFILTDSSGKFSFNTDGNVSVSNPAIQSRQVRWESAEGPVCIEIRNMQGSVVGKYTSGNFDVGYRLSLTSLPTGVYMASITVGNATRVQKIMNIHGRAPGYLQKGIRNEGKGLGKLVVALPTALTFQKATYFPTAMTINGSQSNLSIKMRENFTLSRHDFLTAEEWQCYTGDCQTNQKMYIFRGGKLVWTYTSPSQTEYDDTWRLSDGSITMALRHGARKIKSEKDTGTSWYVYEDVNGGKGETHVLQPIGLDKVFMVVNQGSNAKGFMINTKTGDTLRRWNIPVSGTGSNHTNFRHCRITRDGTMLCAHLDWGRIVEYDTSNMKVLWADSNVTNIGTSPWAAVKLRNGNILYSGNGNKWIREMDRTTHQVIWNVDLTAAGIGLTGGQWCQEIARLDNGNTIVNIANGGPNMAILEISPDKKLVWSVGPKDGILGSSNCQMLDEEGIPEKPGDLLR